MKTTWVKCKHYAPSCLVTAFAVLITVAMAGGTFYLLQTQVTAPFDFIVSALMVLLCVICFAPPIYEIWEFAFYDAEIMFGGCK